jgi:hypothetical protein
VASLDCGPVSGVGATTLPTEGDVGGDTPRDIGPGIARAPGGGGPLDGLIDFGRGFVSQAVDTVTGLWDVVTHPVETVEGLAWAVTHPVETAQVIGESMVAAWNENPAEFLGRAAFEIVTLPVGISKLARLRMANAARDAAQAAGAADKLADAAKLVEVAGAARQSLRARILERIRRLRQGQPVQQEPAFGWQNVNEFPGAGRGINCTRCAVAVDCTLGGASACALPMRDALGNATDDLGTAVNTMGKNGVALKLGLDPSAWKAMGAKSDVIREVESWGSGSKGLVHITYTHQGQRAAHVFNVVNDSGDVMFFEGQAGRLGDANFLVDKIEDLHVIRSTDIGTSGPPLPLGPPQPLPAPPPAP